MELCLSATILDRSPLAPHFLGKPQVLWDGWDNIVAALGRKVRSLRCPKGMRVLESRLDMFYNHLST